MSYQTTVEGITVCEDCGRTLPLGKVWEEEHERWHYTSDED